MEEPIEEVDLQDVFANPFYAINIDPVMAMEHEPMVSEEAWVSANLKAMKEIGAEEWLWHLLKALKNVSGPMELSDEQAEQNL